MSNYHHVARIEAVGDTIYDVLTALDEARKKIEEEYVAGSDSNDTSSYDFTVTQELQTPIK